MSKQKPDTSFVTFVRETAKIPMRVGREIRGSREGIGITSFILWLVASPAVALSFGTIPAVGCISVGTVHYAYALWAAWKEDE